MDFGHVILASASPRRRELLLQIGVVPEIRVSHIEEKMTTNVPWEAVMSLALQKARDVAIEAPRGTTVIGADTVVSIDGKILGKPGSHEEAAMMARLLAGRTHQVYTGVCVIMKDACGRDAERAFYDVADVEIYGMDDDEIDEYARMEEPMDKAGAYAVQGFFARYIKSIHGSYANVMGLPVGKLYQVIKEMKAAGSGSPDRAQAEHGCD